MVKLVRNVSIAAVIPLMAIGDAGVQHGGLALGFWRMRAFLSVVPARISPRPILHCRPRQLARIIIVICEGIDRGQVRTGAPPPDLDNYQYHGMPFD